MISRKTFIAALLAGGLLIGAPVAHAQEVDTYDETPDQELPDTDNNPDTNPDTDVDGDSEDNENDTYDPDLDPDDEAVDPDDQGPSVLGSSLAVTGGDVVGLAAIGGVMLLAGLALSRRRRESS